MHTDSQVLMLINISDNELRFKEDSYFFCKDQLYISSGGKGTGNR